MSTEKETREANSSHEQTSPGSRSNTEPIISESQEIIQEELEQLSQSGITEPGSHRIGARDRTSGPDLLAPGIAGKATP